MQTLTDAEIEALAANIGHFSPEEQAQIAVIIDELERRKHARLCQVSLLEFCKHMDPTYVVAPHHKKLAELLTQIAYGHKDRIAVSIPPRHGKSHLVSTLFPAWFLGKFPDKKVLMVSHTGDLAVDFGRKVRNLIADPKYISIFPEITLAQDSKSAGRWSTNRGGEYFATGVGAALAGRGADLLLVDDPHSEQDLLAGNFEELEKTYQWFAFGARTRLMSGGRIAVIHTRWHQDDLIGHLIKDGINNPKADQYEVFEFPAIMTVKTPTNDPEVPEKVVEKALWPEKFDLDALERTKASMPAYQWNAQYMQNPTGEQGAIIQRDWWQPWEKDDPPQCEYIIMALDAAAEKTNRSDYTALLTFGVFSDDRLTDGASHIILLNAINVRVEFPELKDLAIREWKEWEPDAFIVEKKSSGTPLYQELRRLGIPVQEFTPHRGTGDKVARLNAVADILRSGMVWYPAGRRWAEEVIEQSVAFPYGSHDDLCLVAGVMIEMADGTFQPIERVQVGQEVRTPLGPKPVLAAGFTGVRPTVRLQAQGRIIEGTPGHRIATSRGWIPLDSISLSDTIKMSSTQEASSWLSLKKTASLLSRWCLTVENIIGTQTQRKSPINAITLSAEGADYCTEISGSSTTDLSLKGTTYTIKTATGTTTTFQTSNAYPQQSISKNTPSTHQNSILAPNSLHISKKYALWPLLGTTAKKVKNGVRTLLQRTSNRAAQDVSRLKKHEKNAEKTRLQWYALCVKNRLKRCLLGLSFAQMRARVQTVGATDAEKPVYNLSVAGAECYYANGFLVHNCDCLSMALARYRQGGFIALPSDFRDPEILNRPRHAAYY